MAGRTASFGPSLNAGPLWTAAACCRFSPTALLWQRQVPTTSLLWRRSASNKSIDKWATSPTTVFNSCFIGEFADEQQQADDDKQQQAAGGKRQQAAAVQGLLLQSFVILASLNELLQSLGTRFRFLGCGDPMDDRATITGWARFEIGPGRFDFLKALPFVFR
jgi:hypothetical protein